MTTYLALEDAVQITEAVAGPDMVRDAGLLESAVTMPQMSAFGDDAYPDLAAKAAILLYALTRNHPLVDGNKRLGWTCARVFLLVNGRDIAIDVDAAEELVLAAARGDLDPRLIADIYREHLR